MSNPLGITVSYYTDPLCCHSWVFEKEWKKFIENDGHLFEYHYKMGGLVSNWNSYYDPINLITKPSHMGPVWLELSKKTGIFIQDRIWVEDPPASSYPSCIAFKSAEMQSLKAGEEYLHCLRNAVMVDGLNISKNEILFTIAENLNEKSTVPFSVTQFKENYFNGNALTLFRNDLDTVNNRKIDRFPTITIERPEKKGIIMNGFSPFETLHQALLSMAPELYANTN